MQARMLKQVVGGAALGLMLPLTGVAFAQDDCKINDGSPYQLAGARNYVTMAANARYPSEIPKHLANAIKVLTDDPEKIKNETGRNFLLLRTYAQYLQREGTAYIMRRGDLGFTKNPDGMHNILLAIDSAATSLIAAQPECKERVEPYRARFMTEVFNKAAQYTQDEQYDSALYYADLASSVASADPRPWNVKWAVYDAKKQQDSAKIAMLKVIELAGTDTLYRPIAQQHRYNLAIMTLNEADALEGSAKDMKVNEARALLDAYLKVQPNDPNGMQALGRALRMSGDTAAVAGLFKNMIDSPDSFTEIQLFEGASNAAEIDRFDDAEKLFAAGLAKNPYHRLGLLNAANVYFNMRDPVKMEPVARRLLEVDPNSADARQVYAGFWQVKQRAETDDAKKKAYADSTLAAFQAVQELNPRVEVVRSGKQGNNYVLVGNVWNSSDKEGSWTIKFELLNNKGEVVSTRDVQVGPVASNAKGEFNVSVEAPQAVAFRYAPLK